MFAYLQITFDDIDVKRDAIKIQGVNMFIDLICGLIGAVSFVASISASHQQLPIAGERNYCLESEESEKEKKPIPVLKKREPKTFYVPNWTEWWKALNNTNSDDV